MNVHLKLVVSAENISSMKNALSEIISRLDHDDTVIRKHDDYEYSYDVYTSELLKIFNLEPKDFVNSDGYPNQ